MCFYQSWHFTKVFIRILIKCLKLLENTPFESDELSTGNTLRVLLVGQSLWHCSFSSLESNPEHRLFTERM